MIHSECDAIFGACRLGDVSHVQQLLQQRLLLERNTEKRPPLLQLEDIRDGQVGVGGVVIVLVLVLVLVVMVMVL